MRAARSLAPALALLLSTACSTQSLPLTTPDLAAAPDLAPAQPGADLRDVADLGQGKDGPCDMAQRPSDLAKLPDLSTPPDLTPPPDLELARDLTPPPDLTPAPDLVACGGPAQPCCGGNKCQGNGFACYGDQICRMCGAFGQLPCANETCDMGLYALVDGDFCAMQTPHVCIIPINCGGLGLPPCDDNGNVTMIGGHCIVGRRNVAGTCKACIP